MPGIFISYARDDGEAQAAALRERLAREVSAAEIAARRDRERRYKAAARYHFRDKSKDPRPNQDPNVDLQAA